MFYNTHSPIHISACYLLSSLVTFLDGPISPRLPSAFYSTCCDRFCQYTSSGVVRSQMVCRGRWGEDSISICSRTANRIDLNFSYQLNVTVPLLCVKFRMSAIEIKPPVPRFPSADLNRDNFVRIQRFRFKLRVPLGWTFERMRVKFQSARILLRPRIDIKRFD